MAYPLTVVSFRGPESLEDVLIELTMPLVDPKIDGCTDCLVSQGFLRSGMLHQTKSSLLSLLSRPWLIIVPNPSFLPATV